MPTMDKDTKIDANARIASLQTHSNQLADALVQLCLLRLMPSYEQHIGGRMIRVITEIRSDQLLLDHRNFIIYRLRSVVFHTQKLYETDSFYRSNINKIETLQESVVSGSMQGNTEAIALESGEVQSYLFEDMIYSLMSTFEYVGNLTGYLFQGDEKRKMKWSGAYKASSDNPENSKKSNDSEIKESAVASRIVKHNREFVQHLEEYRAQVFHYQWISPKGKVTWHLIGANEGIELEVSASVAMVKLLKNIVPELKVNSLSVVETAIVLVQEAFKRIEDTIHHLKWTSSELRASPSTSEVT